MAVKHVITRGFGFAGGTKYLPTRGYLFDVSVQQFFHYTAPERVPDFTARSRITEFVAQDRNPDFATSSRTPDFTSNPRNPDFTPSIR